MAVFLSRLPGAKGYVDKKVREKAQEAVRNKLNDMPEVSRKLGWVQLAVLGFIAAEITLVAVRNFYTRAVAIPVCFILFGITVVISRAIRKALDEEDVASQVNKEIDGMTGVYGDIARDRREDIQGVVESEIFGLVPYNFIICPVCFFVDIYYMSNHIY